MPGLAPLRPTEGGSPSTPAWRSLRRALARRLRLAPHGRARPGAARRAGVALASVLALGTCTAIAGQEAPGQPEPPPDSSPAFAWRLNVQWISAARGVSPAETAVNPGNRTLRVPQLLLRSELRPNLRLELGPRWQAIARPRVRTVWQSSTAAGLPRASEHDTAANWTELFANWRPSDHVTLAYGLQNFQWGPAELVSPSNRIFHEVGLFRDPLYYVRGKHLARVNLSAGRQWSLVTLAELGATGEAPFAARTPFRRAAQSKLEFTSASGASYVGATAGVRAGSPPWFGEYGSLAITEGWSVYFDASHSRGTQAWYPVQDRSGVRFVQGDAGAPRIRTFALGGLRYTFEGGIDARLEYVHHQAGYSRRQLELAAVALAAASSPEEAEPYFDPGLDFLGRRLLMASWRFPDLPPGRRAEAQARYLRSLTDRSGVAFLTGSLNAGDALVLFASAAAMHGEPAAEFSRLIRGSLVGGAVWSW
jgi:hypothetical protein